MKRLRKFLREARKPLVAIWAVLVLVAVALAGLWDMSPQQIAMQANQTATLLVDGPCPFETTCADTNMAAGGDAMEWQEDNVWITLTYAGDGKYCQNPLDAMSGVVVTITGVMVDDFDVTHYWAILTVDGVQRGLGFDISVEQIS